MASSQASSHFFILLGKALPFLPEPKNSCWLLLWLVEDHTHTGNNIQKDVHTFMKQSYHVTIIRIVQQKNDLIMSSKIVVKAPVQK